MGSGALRSPFPFWPHLILIIIFRFMIFLSFYHFEHGESPSGRPASRPQPAGRPLISNVLSSQPDSPGPPSPIPPDLPARLRWDNAYNYSTSFLIVNLTLCGLVRIFDTFQSGTKAFKEMGAKMEIPGRDLDFGTTNQQNYSETY